jgi:hypothetical protein
MRSKWLIVSVVATVVMLASATTVFANHSWSKYHWEISAASLSLSIGDNLDAGWSFHLVTANANWNNLTPVLDNGIVTGAATSTDCAPAAGAVEVCAADYGSNGWLGIAGISINRGKDGHITRGYVKLNDYYFDDPDRIYAGDDRWRLFVMCQEVGHIFGLGHQDENFDNGNLDSCMDYTATMTDAQTTPNPHDMDQLETIYVHTHGGDSGSGGGGGNNGRGKPQKAHGAETSQWGRATHVDPAGRADVFERQSANGNLEITLVTWAQ